MLICKVISAATPDEAVHFFSGYDCDSLALEPVTDFAKRIFTGDSVNTECLDGITH